METWLELRELKKAFDRTVALKGLDLKAQKGEFIVVVGASGCGKSTLLRLLAGLERPDSGEIFLDGVAVTQKPPQSRDVAMVFQDYALYPHLTVEENLAFPLRARKMPKDQRDQRIKEVSARLGLDPLLKVWPKTLSGGQRQRVAVGRAWVRNPKLFLYDEPLSNLDAALRGELRRELLSLKETLGITSLYVTHDQTEALTLADRVVVLHQGEALMIGSPKELYERPVHAFVASFIGQPPMKLLRVGEEGGRYSCVAPATSGKGVFLAGCRPEDWQIGPGPGLEVTAEIHSSEYAGHSQTLGLETPQGEPFFLSYSGTVPTDKKLTLHCPPEKLHLFDPESGKRVN